MRDTVIADTDTIVFAVILLSFHLQVLGATFCMGFMYVKATPVNQIIWGDLSNSMMKEQHPDDQR